MDFRQLFTMFTGILSGLALFLFGMNTMSDALSRMTGGGLERVIGKITKNRYSGFMFGTAVTSIVQSSSAITVLTVGLVNSGIMELQKAAGLIMGANLGTTATAWILSLNALSGASLLVEFCKPSSFTPFLGIAGVAMLMFAHASKARRAGSALIGFAVMMIGMNLMGGATAPLKEIPAFSQMMLTLQNPFLGFSFALVFTMIIQSSDAAIGMLQALSMSVGVTFSSAIPMICGAQVGTCITALLSSIDTSNSGRRAALIELYYNLLKNIPFLLIFYSCHRVFHFAFMDTLTGATGIPLFHSLINIIAAVIYLPFSDFIVRLAEKTIPYSEEEEREKRDTLTILDSSLLVNPEFALEQVKASIGIMAKEVQNTYAVMSMNYGDIAGAEDELKIMCARIKKYRVQIVKYTALLREADSGGGIQRALRSEEIYCDAFGRMGELISDHVRIYADIKRKGGEFSAEAASDLRLFVEAVSEVVYFTAESYSMEKNTFAEAITIFREAVSNIHAKITSRHIRRLHSGICNRELSPLFLDLCYGLEKLIDNCDNIAEEQIDYSDETVYSGEAYDEKRKGIFHLFHDKFAILGMND